MVASLRGSFRDIDSYANLCSMVAEVSSDLLENLSEGMLYIKWLDHYMVCHLSDDMKRFADFNGAIPFG